MELSLEERFAAAEGVIFDIDSVLINNYVSSLSQSQLMAYMRRGVMISTFEVIDIQTSSASTEAILKQLADPKDDEEWVEVWRLHEELFERCQHSMAPMSDSAKFVQAVRDSGRKTALWTSRKESFVTPDSCPTIIFPGDNPYRLFDAVSTWSDSDRVKSKPDPASLEALSEKIRIPCDKLIVIDDMPSNIAVARDVGMLTVRMATGFGGFYPRPPTEPEAQQPHLTLDSLEELRPWLRIPPK